MLTCIISLRCQTVSFTLSYLPCSVPFLSVVKDFQSGSTLLLLFIVTGFFNMWFEALISVSRASTGGFILKLL